MAFKRKWGLVDIASSQKVNNVIYSHIAGADDLNLSGEMDDIVREASAVYQTDAEDKEVQSLNKIKYRRQLRDHLQEFADDIVKKY